MTGEFFANTGINDGAAAVLLATGDYASSHNLKPIANIVSWGQCGVDPAFMGVGPIEAAQKAVNDYP